VLDDFGTGYSSLTYLRKVSFDKIKIDASFVRDMLTHPDCASIVKSVIGLANDLGFRTTAEGVEQEQQLAYLENQGCTEAQGNIICPPTSISGLEALFGGEERAFLNSASDCEDWKSCAD
jgi:diguanylate cyclase